MQRKLHGRRSLRFPLLCLLLGGLAGEVAAQAQQCTTSVIGNEEFRGISGSGDGHVVAVGKKGSIATWDGANWVTTASPATEELEDVEVVSPTVAFAVGDKGTVLQLVAGNWIEHAAFTNEQLKGVWAASASEAYVGGKKGTVYSYDGTTWTDEETAAQTDNEDIEDIWGDAASVYLLGDKGTLFRLDRVSGTWDPPDFACDDGGGFEDLWGDGSGNLYLAKKKDIYFHDGVTCAVVATADEEVDGIYGRGANVYAVGKKGTVMHFDGVTWTETQESAEDFRDVWVSPAGNAYYAGKKGEVTTCECLICVIPGFRITHDGFGIHCLDEPVQVDVIDILTGDPITDFAGEMSLDTGSGSGSWSLANGAGVFADATGDDGLATYQWPGTEGSAGFVLAYRTGAPVIDIALVDTADPGTTDDDTEGVLNFSASGLSVTAAALSNPPPAVVAPFSGPVTAGTLYTLHLAAFGQTPNDPECGVIESYNGGQTLNFWSQYLDPGTGTVAFAIDGVAVGSGEAAAAAVPVAFVNGQGSVVARYKDVGRVQIAVKDVSAAHPDLPGGIRGATNPFVSLPQQFVLSGIAAGATLNPGAADASGPAFMAAGDPFSVTVTAVDADGDATPNYGRESVAETVALAATLVAPAGGNNPPVTALVGFGPFAGGQATGADFTWPEVGIVSLVPAVGDGDYLGAGNVTGLASGNVGRFVPHHFASAVNVPAWRTMCTAGGFSYIGAAFVYSSPPVITVVAEAAGNTTTRNYRGAFWKLTNASLANRQYTAVAGTLDATGLPAPATDPVIADLGNGTGTLGFSAGTGLRFQRLAPVAPFDADLSLSIDVRDADAVLATANPVTFATMSFDAGAAMRYGRAVVDSAAGPELLDLAVPLRSEYYLDATNGFVPHSDDVCTLPVTLTLGAYAGNLTAGDTCVRDTGAPGASGAGCAAPAPPATRYAAPPLAGDFNLFLSAPGAGNDGSATVTATVPAWLRFDWDAATPGEENPAGRFTFGVYRGDNATIFLREVF